MLLKIDLPPTPLERARKGKHGFYTPKRSANFKTSFQRIVRSVIGNQPPLEVPLAVKIRFYFKAPMKPKFIHHAVRPDADNCCKSVLDAGNQLLWKDDALIFDLHASKLYDYTGHSRIEIEIDAFPPHAKKHVQKNSSIL